MLANHRCVIPGRGLLRMARRGLAAPWLNRLRRYIETVANIQQKETQK